MPASAAMRRFAVLIPAMLVAALALTLLPAPSADASQRGRKIHHSWEVAGNQKGDRYAYGGDGPRSFDCSGLTQFSYRKSNLYLPRTSDAQAQYTRKIKKSNLRRGDLMFFHSGGDVYHVGIFAGRKNGKATLIHASEPGKPVQRDPVWTRSWFAGTVRGR